MALLTITKAHLFLKSIKSISHYALIPLFFHARKSLFTGSLSFTLPFLRPMCTKTHQSHVKLSLSPDHIKTVDGLISIFTDKAFSVDDQELKNLGPVLTTDIVETVLKGLKSWKIAHMFFTWASNQDGYRHNCYTYNAMASILSHARQNAPLRVLALDIVNSRCSMTPGALGFFIRCLGSLGLVDEANVLFDQVKKIGLCVPNNYSYNCLLEAISQSSSVGLVEMRLKEMHEFGWQPDKYTLTPLLQVYCNAGNFEKGLDVFNEIYNRGWVDAHVFTILVLSFSKWGEVDKAYELIERMKDRNIRLNEKTFCVLIHGFVRKSRMDKALQLFKEMQKLGFAPDIALYDVLIGGLCKNEELQEALHLYSDMKESGIHPDVGILTKLISSFPEETIVQLIAERQDDLDAEAMVLLYNSVLNGFVNKGSIDKAYRLLRAMMGDEFNGDVEVDKLFRVKDMVCRNTTSFSIVIDGLCKTGKLDVALSLFREMVQIGCERNLLLYNNLIAELSNSNRLEESYDLLKEMKESGFKPTHFTHNSIFGCLCRREDVAGALDLVRVMRVYGHKPWIKYYSLLVKRLCKHGRVVEACNFLAKMVQEGFLPDIIAYSAAIDGFIKIQEVDRALDLFREICARGYCPDVVAYNILINGLCKTKRITEAQDVLNEMLLKGLVPSVVTYNLLIDGWCKNGDIDRAILCLSRMVKEEREPNIVTYTTIIDGLCNVGKADDALVFWNEMERKGCSPNRVAFMALIHGLCKCGRPNTALGYLHEMEEKQMKPDTFVFVALVSAFLSDKNPPMAFEILKGMVDKGIFPEPHEKNYSLLRDAMHMLCEDPRTSSSVKSLIAEGVIPTISLSEVGSEGGFEPIV
ncbi:hypothetical protein L1049_023165 [Liquidambar formosana]|uniref:Pentatricopeptide repeat-containing protein n=1 Tax=Liquidambar formosana TaxID=63359 RepID=A0AAP0WRE5_LIQFO